jgi:hexosaminidase
MNMPLLLPIPKKITILSDMFAFRAGDCLLCSMDEIHAILPIVERLQGIISDELKLQLPITAKKARAYRPAVIFEKDVSLAVEAYCITIQSQSVLIRYSCQQGASHAVSTIKQLFMQYGRVLPCAEIEDSPDFPTRGIMLDISRDKIPTMETLYALVDFMADFKLNQLQLYIEGFSFAYSSFPFVWQGGTPMCGEEILKLDQYCKQRFIELVPNQNSFGHMGSWLGRREFAHLAECPGGIEAPWSLGKREGPATLNPLDPGSLKLVKTMFTDLLPYFSSSLFNVGCDETFELGKGKSRIVCEKYGTGRVYLDFILKIHEIVNHLGKRMMFWGDIIMKHPEFISELPKDVIALEWGYEADHPYSEDGRKFHNAGIDYYVCPGTSSWNSIAGRTENMKANLVNAAVNGMENGSVGYLITDWGDNGHWQYLPFSYPGFAYGAALSWNVKGNVGLDITAALDRFVFQDDNGQMGRLIMALGNYYQLEGRNISNGTMIAKILYSGLDKTDEMIEITIKDFNGIREYVSNLEEQLRNNRMRSRDANLIEAEFLNAVLFIKYGCDLGILKAMLEGNADTSSTRPIIRRMTDEIQRLIQQHKELWMRRNRFGGLSDSVKKLLKLKEDITLA